MKTKKKKRKPLKKVNRFAWIPGNIVISTKTKALHIPVLKELQ